MIKLNIQSAPKNLKELEELVGKIVDVRIEESDIIPLIYSGLVDDEHEFLIQQLDYDAEENKFNFTECIESFKVRRDGLVFSEGVVYLKVDDIRSLTYQSSSDGYSQRLEIMKKIDFGMN